MSAADRAADWWRAVIAQVTIAPPLAVTLQIIDERDGPHILASLATTCVTTGAALTVHQQASCPWLHEDVRQGPAVTLALDFVRRMLIVLMTHEVDECLRFNGVHVRDPHPPRTLTPGVARR